MRTIDSLLIRAPARRVFAAAVAVERWPDILPHYRWVTRHGREHDAEIVEMAAWRPFGPFKYPTWWQSRMWTDPAGRAVRYQHIAGITKGMDVEWRLETDGDETEVTIIHQWDGPAWPLVKRPAANWVIGPLFVSAIASRTLAGIGRFAESP
jgi:ribosome-associated toxin RatA of RatAB toxin-antitoxin module